MSNSEILAWPAFEPQVQACLLHLYDYAYLQGNPLVRQLVPDQTGPDRVQAFRDLVTEAVERLRPGANVDLHAKASRSYNILMLRYISQQSTQEVIRNLAFSERQFYREHPKAIRAISGILWERLTGTPVPESAGQDPVEISVESEVQHAHAHSESSRVDLNTLLSGAVDAVQALAEQHSVRLEFTPITDMPLSDADRTVLRQAALGIMSHLITQSPGTGQLRVACHAASKRWQIQFTLIQPGLDPTALQVSLEQHATLQYLLTALGASLTCTHEQAVPPRFTVTLDLSPQQYTILVIDDNPDAIDLFQRYLVGRPYEIIAAHESAPAIQMARESNPDVIILDVMLPGQDGLEVLQNLKNHPATSRIPVLVCSVLDTQDLALSLRADGYLKKPPGQAEFLNVLARWRA